MYVAGNREWPWIKGRKIQFQKQCTVDVASSDTSYGIIIGDGISQANDMIVYLGPASYTTFLMAHLPIITSIPIRFMLDQIARLFCGRLTQFLILQQIVSILLQI